jgi:hypothetical protein
MAEVELPNPEEIAEHHKDHFTRRVALTVACYAVALAITSVAGNNAAKEMMLAQQQSSDQWAHFQAKSIRESEYRIQNATWKRSAISTSKKTPTSISPKCSYKSPL